MCLTFDLSHLGGELSVLKEVISDRKKREQGPCLIIAELDSPSHTHHLGCLNGDLKITVSFLQQSFSPHFYNDCVTTVCDRHLSMTGLEG